MPFLGSQPAEVALTTGDLGDDIVTLAKLAAGTDGNIISYDASGNPVAIATGSDGQVLTSAGAGAPPAFEAAAAGGKLLQIVHGSNASVSTTTTTLPNDNTKPQNTEGGEVVTVAITPANASNKLFITSNIQMTKTTGSHAGYIALFQDSTADALAGAWATNDTANNGNSHSLTHVMTAGTTSATTFKMRGGYVNAGTVTFNGESGGPKLNGTLFSTITIMEISA